MKKLILFCLIFITGAFGQLSQGPKSPTIASPASGWSNTTNIFSLNGVYATNNLIHGTTSSFIVGSGYGFTIPAGSLIQGVVVKIYHIDILGSGEIKDVSVFLVKAGVQVGVNKAFTSLFWAPSAVEEYDYGTSSDLWGTLWSASDINNTGFGAEIQVKNTDLGITQTAGIDYISITVYYKPSGFSQGVIIGQTRTAYFHS